jgi:hypothetical protein
MFLPYEFQPSLNHGKQSGRSVTRLFAQTHTPDTSVYG